MRAPFLVSVTSPVTGLRYRPTTSPDRNATARSTPEPPASATITRPSGRTPIEPAPAPAWIVGGWSRGTRPIVAVTSPLRPGGGWRRGHVACATHATSCASGRAHVTAGSARPSTTDLSGITTSHTERAPRSQDNLKVRRPGPQQGDRRPRGAPIRSVAALSTVRNRPAVGLWTEERRQRCGVDLGGHPLGGTLRSRPHRGAATARPFTPGSFQLGLWALAAPRDRAAVVWGHTPHVMSASGGGPVARLARSASASP